MTDSAAITETRLPSPIGARERLFTLDLLRGVAVLGILPMNAIAYAYPFAAYGNPTLWGWDSNADRIAWAFGHLLFEQKMMTLFSMLFGAGVVVMARRAAARNAPFAGTYYRRMAWLLVIGLIHAYLIWFGDILVSYALLGAGLYPLRNLRASRLVAIGCAMLLVLGVVTAGLGVWLQRTAAEAERIERTLATGGAVAASEEELLAAWRDLSASLYPPRQEIEREVRIYREGSVVERLRLRARQAFPLQTGFLLLFGVWRIGAAMLFGMALMKCGFLAGAHGRRGAWLAIAGGYGVGLPLVVWGAARLFALRFDPVDSFAGAGWGNLFGSLPVAIGHAGVVLLLAPRLASTRIGRRLAAVGRMALSNYIAQSLIATTLFYHLGWFGALGRPQLWLVVLAIWMVELAWSAPWLARHRFGPLEWVWRRLTYGRPI